MKLGHKKVTLATNDVCAIVVYTVKGDIVYTVKGGID